ncbi:MAG TPA: PrsW family glutamic-type intramembrane protease [Candidatus Paceibacterota bacterium]|nr:PrsW family glutamic-type intramembrane protease [Candidatus Paceibacterota bacterium]
MLLLSMVLGLVPGFAWLVFYLSEDPHPEPKRLIVLTFFVGIAFGFFTVIIEQFFNDAMGAIGVAELSALSLVCLAFIEEFMKYAAAYFAVGKSPELDEPIDAMIYMIVAALGFATLENIGALTNVAAAAASGSLVATVFETASLRFVGATLLHSLTSAIVGYHWALGMARKNVPHYLISGFIIATILHATFNYLILNYADVGYSVLFLLVVGFFVLNDFEELKKQPAASAA